MFPQIRTSAKTVLLQSANKNSVRKDICTQDNRAPTILFNIFTVAAAVRHKRIASVKRYSLYIIYNTKLLVSAFLNKCTIYIHNIII